MVNVKKLVLDILKPHQPNALDFSRTIAEVGTNYRVRLTVMGAPVPARTVWTRQGTGALNFDRPITPAQLSTLRQFRDFARREGG